MPLTDEDEVISAAFRKAGMKATRQRLEIYRELTGTDAHPDAETVFKRVRRKIPTISFDTVYRTLHTLEQAGLVVRIGPALDRARFDACLDPHHHFVCEQCGSIIDFQDDKLNGLPQFGTVSRIGSVHSISYVLRGVCLRCKKGQGEKPDR